MKIQPYRFFEYDICVWVDGNIRIKKNLNKLCEKFPNVQFAVARHPDRDCIYDECEAIIRYHKDTRKNMETQVNLYRSDGYPAHNGLCETNVMIRLNTPEVNRLMDMWADWLRRYSHRDQMSLNYCMWKLGFEFCGIPENVRRMYFQWGAHKGYRR